MAVESLDKYVTQKYPIECKGRNLLRKDVLSEPVRVLVEIFKSPDSNTISSNVECPYNIGGHGDRCKASHPEVDKKEVGVSCPYSFDIPYAIDKQRR